MTTLRAEVKTSGVARPATELPAAALAATAERAVTPGFALVPERLLADPSGQISATMFNSENGVQFIDGAVFAQLGLGQFFSGLSGVVTERATLEQAIASQELEVERLNGELQAAEAERDAKREAVLALEAELAGMAVSNEATDASVRAKQAEFSELQESYADALRQVAAFREELGAALENTQTAQSNHAVAIDLRQETARLKAELDQNSPAVTQAAEMQAELARVGAAHAALTNDAVTGIPQIRDVLAPFAAFAGEKANSVLAVIDSLLARARAAQAAVPVVTAPVVNEASASEPAVSAPVPAPELATELTLAEPISELASEPAVETVDVMIVPAAEAEALLSMPEGEAAETPASIVYAPVVGEGPALEAATEPALAEPVVEKVDAMSMPAEEAEALLSMPEAAQAVTPVEIHAAPAISEAAPIPELASVAPTESSELTAPVVSDPAPVATAGTVDAELAAKKEALKTAALALRAALPKQKAGEARELTELRGYLSLVAKSVDSNVQPRGLGDRAMNHLTNIVTTNAEFRELYYAYVAALKALYPNMPLQSRLALAPGR